jgi:hypothetical protein
LQTIQNTSDNPRDTFTQKSMDGEPENAPVSLPADLAEIAALWTDLPDHVRAGLVAMAKAAMGKGV